MSRRRAGPLWIRLLLALTSPWAQALMVLAAGVVVAIAIYTQVAVAQSARRAAMTEAVLRYVGSRPPTDEILRQADVDWLRSFYGALVARVDRPLANGAAIFAGAGAAAFIGFGRAVRPGLKRFATLDTDDRADGAPYHCRWSRSAWAAAAVAGILAVVVHWPTYTSVIRYDEDQASLLASYGWWDWANNLPGWQVHVAAMFTIRLMTAVFGVHPWAVRLPALLASSLAMGGLAGMMTRRFSLMSAAVATAVVFCVPLWAEQTTLARGYGLSFAAGVMTVVAVIRLYDEKDRPRSTSVLLLTAGVLIGCLAHFFFLFMVLGLLTAIFQARPVSRDVRRAEAFAIFVALIVPAVSFAMGLPAIVFQSYAVTDVGLRAVVERFEFELMFRNPPPLGLVAAAIAATLVTVAFAVLPKRARTAAMLVLLCSVALPVAMKPVYLYPRFFLHLLPLTAAGAGWAFGRGRFGMFGERGRSAVHRLLPGVAALLACAGLLIASPPWRQPVFVDLLAASKVAADETVKLGNAFAVDRDLVPGVRFYRPALRPRIVQFQAVPDDVQQMLAGVPDGTLPQGVLAHFTVARQWPGSEHTIYLLRRKTP